MKFVSLSTYANYAELDDCAEGAFDIVFAKATSEDFKTIYDQLKSFPTLDKYLEWEKAAHAYWLSDLALRKLSYKPRDKHLSAAHENLRLYARWRLVTQGLLLQNRLLELESVQTSSMNKAVDISLNFLLAQQRLFELAPFWHERFGSSSPFLNADGSEIRYEVDIIYPE